MNRPEFAVRAGAEGSRDQPEISLGLRKGAASGGSRKHQCAVCAGHEGNPLALVYFLRGPPLNIKSRPGLAGDTGGEFLKNFCFGMQFHQERAPGCRVRRAGIGRGTENGENNGTIALLVPQDDFSCTGVALKPEPLRHHKGELVLSHGDQSIVEWNLKFRRLLQQCRLATAARFRTGPQRKPNRQTARRDQPKWQGAIKARRIRLSGHEKDRVGEGLLVTSPGGGAAQRGPDHPVHAAVMPGGSPVEVVKFTSNVKFRCGRGVIRRRLLKLRRCLRARI